jgi:hypothetical protein
MPATTAQAEGHLDTGVLASLRESFRGELMLPSDDGYEQARAASGTASEVRRPPRLGRAIDFSGTPPSTSRFFNALRVRQSTFLTISISSSIR